MDAGSNPSSYARRLKRRTRLRIACQLDADVIAPAIHDDAPASPERRHAAQRWARSVAAAVGCGEDPTTVAAWSRAAGIGRRPLGARCRAAGVPVRSSLQFCRVLRGVVLASRLGRHLDGVASGVGERTMRALLVRAGIRPHPSRRPSIGEFLRWQRFTRCKLNVDAVADEISAVLESLQARRGPDAPRSDCRP